MARESPAPASAPLPSPEVGAPRGVVGQDRALDALEFGLSIREEGFNLFVAGPPGIGKMTALRAFLEESSTARSTPPDWCYVCNFSVELSAVGIIRRRSRTASRRLAAPLLQ